MKDLENFEKRVAFVLSEMMLVKYRAPTREERETFRQVTVKVGLVEVSKDTEVNAETVGDAAKKCAVAVVGFMSREGHTAPVFVRAYAMADKLRDDVFGVVAEFGVPGMLQ